MLQSKQVKQAQAQSAKVAQQEDPLADSSLMQSAGNQAIQHLLESTQLSVGNNISYPRAGRPLPPKTAANMAQKFGRSLDNVRVHTDAEANRSAAGMGAKAYTVGSDIVFGPGYYAPETHIGQQLLAHELTHVLQQSQVGGGGGTYAAAEAEAQSVARSPLGMNTAVSQAVPAGTIQAEEEEGMLESAGSWVLGAIGGEFVDDPSYGQIAVDFVLSVIPYVDQGADLRDLIAHIYRLGFRNEYKQVMRWVSLVFTLLGLIPELGSVIKSASKAIFHFVGRNASSLMTLFRRLLTHIPSAGGSLRGLRHFIASNWANWARYGRGKWDDLLAASGRYVDELTAQIQRVRSVPGILINRARAYLNGRLQNLRRLSGEHLSRAFNDVRERILSKMDELAESLGPRRATAGAPHIPDTPPRSNQAHMSSNNASGGGRHTPSMPDISHTFQTTRRKANGKVYVSTSGELGIPGQVKRHRDRNAQRRVSRGSGDDAGHRIGDRFGAPGGESNLAPQNWRANQYGTFSNLEDEWASKLQSGTRIEVEVTDIMRTGEERPFMRTARWTETAPNGTVTSHERIFANTHTQKSRAAQEIESTVSNQSNNVIDLDAARRQRGR